MCLLIYKKAGVTIPEEHLKEAFDNNSHGAGFSVRMVNEAGEGYIHRERGFFKFDAFLDAYRPFAPNQGIVHFRLATAGKKDEENCHPFEITSDLHMGHNGIISIAQSLSKDHSDTWHFVEQVMKPIREDMGDDKFLANTGLHFLIDVAIGSSKLAFLHADGRHLIVNEEAGHWDDKDNPQIWYSNNSYEMPRFTRSKVVSGYNWGGSYNTSGYSHSTSFSSCGWDTEDRYERFRSSKSDLSPLSESKSDAALPAHYSQAALPAPTPIEQLEELGEFTAKDLRRLAHARKKFGEDSFIVDEALDAGYSAKEIAALANQRDGKSFLFEQLYADGTTIEEMRQYADYNASYRRYGDTIEDEVD